MWFDVLKRSAGRKIKMHLPTLKIKVAEWAEMNREGRHKPQEIIDYVKDDVIEASVNDWANNKDMDANWVLSNINRVRGNYAKKLETKGINTWMFFIKPILVALGFKQFRAGVLEREEGYSGVMYQDEKDALEMRRRTDYESQRRRSRPVQSNRYGGPADRWEGNSGNYSLGNRGD